MHAALVPPPGATWEHWQTLAATLTAPPGVHLPSAFSCALAAALPDLTGKTAIDAGSGAGLITIAALARGAHHVIALDSDQNALHATRAAVEQILGTTAISRLSLFCSDFRHLNLLNADVVLANPPQRPTRILQLVEPDQQHLHQGGGPDGLNGLRLLMGHTTAPVLITTAATLLDLAPLDTHPRWHQRTPIATTDVPLHPAWTELGPDGQVTIWQFRRRPRPALDRITTDPDEAPDVPLGMTEDELAAFIQAGRAAGGKHRADELPNLET